MIQYATQVGWDLSLIDLEYTDIENPLVKGLVYFGIKITTGAPVATAGKFTKGCQIQNAYDGTWYENTGTTASPVWSLVPSTGSGITTLTGDVTAGPGTGSQAATVVKASGDFKVFGNTTLGDTSSQTITFAGKQVGTLYRNETSSSVMSLKQHNHLSTSTIGTLEGKYETVNTSGANTGIWNEAHISATGTASITASLNAAVVAATFTVTDGTIIGVYGQARADGTVAGSSIMAGVYGLIEASTAITASHVCSAWLDSHQANAVTGSHELLYMTNNGAAVMDQAIYVYGGNKITNLMELNTVSGMVSDTAETAGDSKKIKITVDGATFYVNAYAGA